MSFVYFNSWMPASLESAWTNAWGCVHVSGWSGLAAGLNNCLSSAAPPPPSSTPCVLIQSSCPGLFSSPLVTCVSSSRGAAGTWSHSSKGSWCVAPWPAGSGAHWQGNRDALVPAQVRFPVLWVRLSTMMTTRCIYTFFFFFYWSGDFSAVWKPNACLAQGCRQLLASDLVWCPKGECVEMHWLAGTEILVFWVLTVSLAKPVEARMLICPALKPSL